MDGNENVTDLDPVDLRNIEALQIITAGSDSQGEEHGASLNLTLYVLNGFKET